MYAISVDPVERNREVVDRLGLDFPILSDADRRAVAAYGVMHAGAGMGGVDIARPATFLIGPDGVVRWRDLTDNWRVRVSPDAVIEAVQELR